jgi:cell division protein FtsB
MSEKKKRLKPLLSVPQILVILALIAGLVIALDLNRRAQAGRLVGVGEGALERELELEATRQVHLQATATYVFSDNYIESYARNEGGLIQPGEKRVVPIIAEIEPTPTPPPPPTPDPAGLARPWQAWWRLLSDAPVPAR